MYCFFTVLPVYVLSCAASGVIKNDDDDKISSLVHTVVDYSPPTIISV